MSTTIERKAGEEGACARREEILAVATGLFAEHGYSDTVTQALAEKLQVGKGTIYRYFPSKRELFLAAVDRVLRHLRECVEASIATVDDPLERIAQAVRAYLAFFAGHPEFVELLIQERALFKDRKTTAYFEHQEARALLWQGRYRALIAEGRVREMPVERITDVMNSLLYGTMFGNYFTGQHPPFEKQTRDILDVVFRGILTDAERSRLDGGPSGPGAAPRVGAAGDDVPR